MDNTKSVLDPVEVQTTEKKVVLDQNNESMQLKQIKPNTSKKSNKFLKVIAVVIGVLLVLALLIVVFVVIPAKAVYTNAMVIMSRTSAVKEAIISQDLNKVKQQLTVVKGDLSKTETSFNNLSWTRGLPIVGPYWNDGKALLTAGARGIETAEILITSIEPYADIIGLTGGTKTATDGQKTASDRIDFVIKSVDAFAPQMDQIGAKVSLIETELNKIDENRYPVDFRGIKVRDSITQAKQLTNEAAKLLSTGKPLAQQASYLLGAKEPRTYLLLFQNDKELRPTGGFMTAYSFITVSKGKFQPTSSNDIYTLDAKYTPVIPAPAPIIKYIKGPYVASKNLRLRDMNWSPDFKTSMDTFYSEAQKVGIKNIDGIIAVDTQVLVNVLDVLGEIGVSGFGNFSTKIDPECNCPQVVHELEKYADVEGAVVWSENEPGKIVFAPKNYGINRKGIIGPLMNSVMANALGQPKEKLKGLFEAGYKSVMEKHVLLYMTDPVVQKAVADFGIAGSIQNYDGDYLHINDANLGGRKSNLYVTQEVNQEVKVASDGTATKTLTITYNNTQSYDGWLNSVLPDWTRIYVPKGSTLVSFDGLEEKGDTYEELGKTVFSGGFQLRPKGVVKLTLTYKLPFKVKGTYKLYVQKQPGVDSIMFSLKVGKKTIEEKLTADKEFSISL